MLAWVARYSTSDLGAICSQIDPAFFQSGVTRRDRPCATGRHRGLLTRGLDLELHAPYHAYRPAPRREPLQVPRRHFAQASHWPALVPRLLASLAGHTNQAKATRYSPSPSMYFATTNRSIQTILRLPGLLQLLLDVVV